MHSLQLSLFIVLFNDNDDKHKKTEIETPFEKHKTYLLRVISRSV